MNKMIVSCQALDDEPLHSPFIMGKMAKAALEGGAQGIRANSVIDIKSIKTEVDLPIIGIIKEEYSDSNVYITPTIDEIDALVKEGVDIIATDATFRARPNKQTLDEFFTIVKEEYPDQKFMADCSTFEEMHYADELGFDYISTTLFGYTDQSRDNAFVDLQVLKDEVKNIKAKLVAEGQISSPNMAKEIASLNCFNLIVIGSAITRPQLITKEFYERINHEKV